VQYEKDVVYKAQLCFIFASKTSENKNWDLP
jgi:hypothetical protein